MQSRIIGTLSCKEGSINTNLGYKDWNFRLYNPIWKDNFFNKFFKINLTSNLKKISNLLTIHIWSLICSSDQWYLRTSMFLRPSKKLRFSPGRLRTMGLQKTDKGILKHLFAVWTIVYRLTITKSSL